MIKLMKPEKKMEMSEQTLSKKLSTIEDDNQSLRSQFEECNAEFIKAKVFEHKVSHNEQGINTIITIIFHMLWSLR